MVFLNAIVGDVLHIFAYFCNISFVFYIVSYVYALWLCVAFMACVAPCMVHGIGMHVMHHIIIDVFIIMFIMFIMFIVDHHHVRCSLINDQ